MQTRELVLSPEEAFDEDRFTDFLYEKLSIKKDGDTWVRPIKRSIDARGKKVIIRVLCEISTAQKKTIN